MKTIKWITVFLLCVTNSIYSQPLIGKFVQIKSVCLENDTLFFTSDNGIVFNFINKNENGYLSDRNIYIPTSRFANEMYMYTYFIYQKDTMSINVLYNHYDIMEISIKKWSL
jgi:hypothetical protein